MVDDVSASTTISIDHMGLDFTDHFTYLGATITNEILTWKLTVSQSQKEIIGKQLDEHPHHTESIPDMVILHSDIKAQTAYIKLEKSRNAPIYPAYCVYSVSNGETN